MTTAPAMTRTVFCGRRGSNIFDRMQYRDKQGTKAIGSQGGRFKRIVAANDSMAFGVEINTRRSPWRQPNALSPGQLFSYDADQRLRVKLDLASVSNGDRSESSVAPDSTTAAKATQVYRPAHNCIPAGHAAGLYPPRLAIEPVAVRRRGHLERVHHAAQRDIEIRHCRQLDQPLRAVALQQCVEHRLARRGWCA